MAKDDKKKDESTEGQQAAPAAATEAPKKTRPPRMVDETIAERDPVVVIDVKESTFPAAITFIQKALAAAQGDPYNGTTIKGSLKVYADEAE